MRYDYLTNTLPDGSPGVANLKTRFLRTHLMVESGRWTVDEALEFIMRDFPYVERIHRAVDWGPREGTGIFPRGFDE